MELFHRVDGGQVIRLLERIHQVFGGIVRISSQFDEVRVQMAVVQVDVQPLRLVKLLLRLVVLAIFDQFATWTSRRSIMVTAHCCCFVLQNGISPKIKVK